MPYVMPNRKRRLSRGPYIERRRLEEGAAMEGRQYRQRHISSFHLNALLPE